MLFNRRNKREVTATRKDAETDFSRSPGPPGPPADLPPPCHPPLRDHPPIKKEILPGVFATIENSIITKVEGDIEKGPYAAGIQACAAVGLFVIEKDAESQGMTAVERAIALAYKAHDGQKRWGGEPYIIHPIRVATRVKMLGDDYEVVALLHDVVEDTDVEEADIRRVFGATVADAVAALTRIEEPTKEPYKDFIIRASKNEIARAVKRADIEDNISDMSEKHELFKRYFNALKLLEQL